MWLSWKKLKESEQLFVIYKTSNANVCCWGKEQGEMRMRFGIIVGYRLQFHLDGPALARTIPRFGFWKKKKILKCMSALCGLWFVLKGCWWCDQEVCRRRLSGCVLPGYHGGVSECWRGCAVSAGGQLWAPGAVLSKELRHLWVLRCQLVGTGVKDVWAEFKLS